MGADDSLRDDLRALAALLPSVRRVNPSYDSAFASTQATGNDPLPAAQTADNPFIDCRTTRAAGAIRRRLDSDGGHGLGHVPHRYYEAAAEALTAAESYGSVLPAALEAARGVETLLGRVRTLEAEVERLREAVAEVLPNLLGWCPSLEDSESYLRLAEVADPRRAVAEENVRASAAVLP